MNNIVNKFLLAGGKFMPEMHLSLDSAIVLADHLLKIRKEYINLKNVRFRIYL